jgi:hypothetical protein
MVGLLSVGNEVRVQVGEPLDHLTVEGHPAGVWFVHGAGAQQTGHVVKVEGAELVEGEQRGTTGVRGPGFVQLMHRPVEGVGQHRCQQIALGGASAEANERELAAHERLQMGAQPPEVQRHTFNHGAGHVGAAMLQPEPGEGGPNVVGR